MASGGGEDRPDPVTVPMARWAADLPGEVLAYDPVTGGFQTPHR